MDLQIGNETTLPTEPMEWDSVAVIGYVVLGDLFLLMAAVFESWRSCSGACCGTDKRKTSKLPSNDCVAFFDSGSKSARCGQVICYGGLAVPFILVICLGLLILALNAGDDICKTALGYCSTISCVCGNVIWHGYVFMFITLVLAPIVLVISLLRGFEKDHLMVSNDKEKGHNFIIVMAWIYLVSIACTCLTGMLPALEESGTISDALAEIANLGHLLGVGFGVGGSALVALCLGIHYLYISCSTANDNASDRKPNRIGAGIVYIVMTASVVATGFSFLRYKGQYKADGDLQSVYDICVINADVMECSLGNSSGCQWFEGRV